MWSVAVLEGRPTPTGLGQYRPLRVFNSKQVRRGRRHIHTRADPYLIVRGEKLYLFYEVQEVGGRGYIAACVTSDLASFEDLGPVFCPTDHVSYPCVFETADGIFMVPETKSAGEVALYRFTNFPRGVRRERRLLTGAYSDPTIFFHGGRWWLFATQGTRLELFSASDLVSQEFASHPMNPICTNALLSRCGGVALQMQGGLYRPAQPALVDDGSNLRMLRIHELSVDRYSEDQSAPEFFSLIEPWQALGGHHISSVTFRGRWVTAVDGRQHDTLVNTLLLNPLWRAVSLLMPPSAGQKGEPRPYATSSDPVVLTRLRGRRPSRAGLQQRPEPVSNRNAPAQPSR